MKEVLGPSAIVDNLRETLVLNEADLENIVLRYLSFPKWTDVVGAKTNG